MNEEDIGKLLRVLERIAFSLEIIAHQKISPERKPIVTEEVKSDITIEYEDRTYSRFKPCKYKCSYWTSWADDYKKGDKILHINPMTKEVIGFQCPKFDT